MIGAYLVTGPWSSKRSGDSGAAPGSHLGQHPVMSTAGDSAPHRVHLEPSPYGGIANDARMRLSRSQIATS